MHSTALRLLAFTAVLAGLLPAQEPTHISPVGGLIDLKPNTAGGPVADALLSQLVSANRAFEMRVPMDRFFEDDGDGDVTASTVPAVPANPNRLTAGSDVASGKPVPMLGDIPVIGSLFAAPGGRFSPREAWFVRYLRSAAGPEISVSFEETRIRRYDAETSRVTLRREALIKGPDTAKAKLDEALDRLAASRGKGVLVEMIVATRNVAAGESPAKSGATAENIDSLDGTAFAAALRTLKEGKYPELNVISAPKLITNHGSRASISIGDTLSYVKEYRLTVVGAGTTVADPVVDTVTEGMMFDLVPCLEGDGKSATIRLGVEIKRVARPIPSFVAKVGEAELKTELPATATQSFTATLLAPTDGGGMRIHGLRWTDPATKKEIAAEIYLKVERIGDNTLVGRKPEGALGERIYTGTDGGAGLVIVDVRDRKELAEMKAGAKLEAMAEGKVVGVWEVQQSAEGILLLKRVEGLPLGPAQELRAR